jgi:hypothetical protein
MLCPRPSEGVIPNEERDLLFVLSPAWPPRRVSPRTTCRPLSEAHFLPILCRGTACCARAVSPGVIPNGKRDLLFVLSPACPPWPVAARHTLSEGL